jgi:hypothetical protein
MNDIFSNNLLKIRLLNVMLHKNAFIYQLNLQQIF